MTTEQQALSRAVKKAGGTPYKLAQILPASKQTVYNWIKAGRVQSALGAIAVERATGVSRHELRPDIFGERA